jgi:ribose/xylose/arabinose/galactoside ABC-type transport system permease subunit
MSTGMENAAATQIDATRGEGGSPPNRPRSAVARAATFLQRPGMAALVVLIALVAVSSVTWSSFHTMDNLRNVLLGNSYIAIVAVGMTLVIITGGIDLSVGSVFALGGVIGVFMNAHGGVAVAVLATVLACAVVGLVNGVLIGYAGLAPFIVTLATLLGVRGLVLYLTKEGQITNQVPAGSAFAHLGTGTVLTFGMPILIAIVIYIVGHIVLERTPFGLTVSAIGGSESAATLMGLKVRRTKVLLYVLSAVLAGVAGMLQAAQLVSASPIIAVGYELQAIAAVVIGGTLLTGGSGTLIGTAAGVLLLGAINSVINELQLENTWQTVISGGFLIVVVVVQRLLTRARLQ